MRHSEKGFSKFLLCLVAVVGVGSCSQQRAGSILVVLPTASNPFWQDIARGASAVSDSLGQATAVHVRVGSADTDVRSQEETLRNFLSAGNVRVLVLGPASASSVVPVVAQYNARNIPVIVVDSKLDSAELVRQKAHVDYFLGSENSEGGRLAAEKISAVVGPKEVSIVLLGGSPDHETAIARAGGFRSAAPANWRVREVVANWSRSEANRVIRALAQQAVPSAIFAANDEMALGAVAALESLGIQPNHWPVIVGFDATMDARTAIRGGRMCASMAQQPVLIGRRATEVAVLFLRGERPANRSESVPVTIVTDSSATGCRSPSTVQSSP